MASSCNAFNCKILNDPLLITARPLHQNALAVRLCWLVKVDSHLAYHRYQLLSAIESFIVSYDNLHTKTQQEQDYPFTDLSQDLPYTHDNAVLEDANQRKRFLTDSCMASLDKQRELANKFLQLSKQLKEEEKQSDNNNYDFSTEGQTNHVINNLSNLTLSSSSSTSSSSTTTTPYSASINNNVNTATKRHLLNQMTDIINQRDQEGATFSLLLDSLVGEPYSDDPTTNAIVMNPIRRALQNQHHIRLNDFTQDHLTKRFYWERINDIDRKRARVDESITEVVTDLVLMSRVPLSL